MTDRFDDAKRALEGASAPDLWAEAERRAAEASVVPLDDAAGGRSGSRPRRWLAAAAVVAILGGAVGLALTQDDPDVRTGPAGTGAVVPLVPPTSDFPAFDGQCPFALDGDGPHQVIADGTSPWFGPDSQPVEQQVVQLQLGSTQTAEIAVPGVVLTDLVGERVEDVELARGTGQVWFSPDFVQVRWFPGSQESCESFTVTVGGGTEDGNRHAAVDLAEQVRLPSDLRAAIDRSIEGDWVLAGATLDGDDLSVEPLGFSFHDSAAQWDDGCNQVSGAYAVAGATSILISRIESTYAYCPSPLSEAIDTVMRADVIALSTTEDTLVLRDDSVVDGATLTLRPAEDRTTPPTEPPADAATEAYGIWPTTAPERLLGYAPEITGTQAEIAGAFAREVLAWADATVTEGEPSEDGSFGAAYLVTSDALGRTVEVRVRAGEPSGVNVVYSVDVPERSGDPEASAWVQVDGGRARAHATPTPAGTDQVDQRFTYGEYVYEGPAGEWLDLFSSDQHLGIPGAALIVYRDAEGRALGAWGTALPAGDFAAG